MARLPEPVNKTERLLIVTLRCAMCQKEWSQTSKAHLDSCIYCGASPGKINIVGQS